MLKTVLTCAVLFACFASSAVAQEIGLTPEVKRHVEIFERLKVGGLKPAEETALREEFIPLNDAIRDAEHETLVTQGKASARAVPRIFSNNSVAAGDVVDLLIDTPEDGQIACKLVVNSGPANVAEGTMFGESKPEGGNRVPLMVNFSGPAKATATVNVDPSPGTIELVTVSGTVAKEGNGFRLKIATSKPRR